MPQSRNRAGHKYQKPSDIPARVRTRGRIVWAILFAVFGMAMGFFGSDQSVIGLVIGALLGGGLGYFVGKNVEQQAANN
ncbi:MAG: glycine zipper domain-containing protein [Candidatus Dadabacteria bacterium]